MYDPLTTPTEPMAIIDLPGAPNRSKTTPSSTDPGTRDRTNLAPTPPNQLS